MTTRDSQSRYVLYLLDELSSEDAATLRAQLETDAEARSELEATRKMLAELDEALALPQGAEDLAERIIRRLDALEAPPRQVDRRWLAALAAAVCVLLALGLWWIWPHETSTPSAVDDRPASADDLIVVSPVPPNGSGDKPRPPFWNEANADLIAIAVMGESPAPREQKVIRMQLVEALKGQQQLGSLESADGTVRFGCTIPNNLKQFSDMYRKGERVAIYLKKTDDGWSTLQMTHLTAEVEPQWKTRVQSFLDVLLASATEDPALRYAQLLAQGSAGRDHAMSPGPGLTSQSPGPRVTSRANGAPGWTEAFYYGLAYNPDPRAAPLVRELLVASARNLGNALQSPVEPLASADPFERSRGSAAPPAGIPNSPLAYATLLAKMHDAESISPVMSVMAGVTAEQRLEFLRLLPDLCRDADRQTLQFVQSELSKYADALRSGEQNEYAQTLADTQRSIGQLWEKRGTEDHDRKNKDP